MPYTFLEHKGDICMQVTGETPEELFEDALLGMVFSMKPEKQQVNKSIERKISVKAEDMTELMVDFLSEALVWMHTDREVYTHVQFRTLTKRALKAELTGYRAAAFGEDIKAVTYHEADVRKEKDGLWKTNIIFDI